MSETYSPAGNVSAQTYKRATAGEAATGTFGDEFMRQDMTQIADRIRFLGDDGFPNVSKIAFPATQVPSAGANDLDDYEEGSWTPSIGGTATYTIQFARYIKIGKLVFVAADLQINALGTGSNNTISGLPFASASNGFSQAGNVNFYTGLAVNVIFLSAFAVNGASTVQFAYSAAAGAAMTAAAAILGAAARVNFSICYEATA